MMDDLWSTRTQGTKKSETSKSQKPYLGEVALQTLKENHYACHVKTTNERWETLHDKSSSSGTGSTAKKKDSRQRTAKEGDRRLSSENELPVPPFLMNFSDVLQLLRRMRSSPDVCLFHRQAGWKAIQVRWEESLFEVEKLMQSAQASGARCRFFVFSFISARAAGEDTRASFFASPLRLEAINKYNVAQMKMQESHAVYRKAGLDFNAIFTQACTTSFHFLVSSVTEINLHGSAYHFQLCWVLHDWKG